MAIALTTQPTTDGLYSGYLPVKFVATETTNNPAYLEFTLLTSAGAAITGVPRYRALKINNTYTFDASNYLKSIFNVRSSQGLSTTAIEDLTDSYGHYEVVVSDPINGLTDLTSNHFYAFANIDGIRYLNDQTANDGITRKVLLYGSELGSQTPANFAPKIQGDFDRLVLFYDGANDIYIRTYQIDKPNNSSVVYQNAAMTISASYINKLISVPLNRNYIQTYATLIGSGGVLSPYRGFLAFYNLGGNSVFYHYSDCNTTEFVFINKYGVKENIKFQSYDYERLSTRGGEFLAAGYTATGNNNYFNTSADAEKINQNTESDYDIKGQYFNGVHKEELKDFIASPKYWVVVGGELVPCLVQDGSFVLSDKSKGVNFNFKYKLAQSKLSFA